jgi:hypothetical protein
VSLLSLRTDIIVHAFGNLARIAEFAIDVH